MIRGSFSVLASLLAAFATCAASAALAQQVLVRPVEPQPQQAGAAPAAETLPEIDWSRVQFDAYSLTRDRDAGYRAPDAGPAQTWSRSENRNGSANMTIKRPWANGLETQIGVDGVAASQSTLLPPVDPTPSGSPNSTGWASANMPAFGPIDQANVDARFDPQHEQRTLGARFSKSVPLSDAFSITLQNRYSLHQSLASSPQTAGAPTQVLDTERLAKINLLQSGTSLIAGTRHSSTEERWRNTVGAEQKLFGGVSVTGTVSETADGMSNRSLTAGFRRQW